MTVTRRSLLALSAASVLLPRHANAAKLFPRPDIIRYDSDCFTIRGVDTFIFSLECPYPRVRPSAWADRLSKIRQAGFNTVDSYVFWNYHERTPGQFDFSELEHFLDMAQKFGLFVILRPGPYVDAEFERGGFPAYVIARRIQVRSMHPESLAISKHWYDHVLPVIKRYQITEGGPVIMMQIENEIDFTDVPLPEQREYIRFLAQLAWQGGIDVPLISNVSSVVRDRSDPDMARILDACDFYPRWSFLTDNELPKPGTPMTMEEKVGLSDRAVQASLRKMRAEEPAAPLSVAELGTGYYSKFEGKLAEDEDGADATELNALTKTILSQGVTYFNYYLGWGGTNFDWGAKTVTTTYDFAAPIREGGGLWEKYYVVHGVGACLKLFGSLLTRSRMVADGARSTHPDVTLVCRQAHGSALLFVRANTESEHHFSLNVSDPRSASRFNVPLHGQLTIGPRAMKIMPVQVELGGPTWHYSTAEVLAQGRHGRENFVLIYDDIGSLVEFAVAADRAHDVRGDTEYVMWDQARAALVVGVRLGAAPLSLRIADGVRVIGLPRDMALRSWVVRAGDVDLAFLSDAYFLAASDEGAMELQYLPGMHVLDILVASPPSSIMIDGVSVPVAYDADTGFARVELTIPGPPAHAIGIASLSVWLDRLDSKDGHWISVTEKPLDELAPVPYGYVKYRTDFTYQGEDEIFITAYGINPKKVFINGTFVPVASVADRFVVVRARDQLKGILRPGKNVIEISYEQFGSNEFGETARLIELNGMQSVRAGSAGNGPPTIWDVQMRPPPMRDRALDPAFLFPAAKAVATGAEASGAPTAAAFAWCRGNFRLPETTGWVVPWRLAFAADRDALFYLNGAFIGRFVAAGPQFNFILPVDSLRPAGVLNELTIVLAYAETADGITTLRIEPCMEATVATRLLRVSW